MSIDVWREVVFAFDCEACPFCGEPVCPSCDEHYASCTCPGPHEEEAYEYREIGGVLMAKRRVN